MKKTMIKAGVLALGTLCFAFPANAKSMCATDEQAEQVQAYYAEHPGATPLVAARETKIPEEIIASSLGHDLAVSVGADAFAQVWQAMTTWEKAITIVTSGPSVIEVFSPVPPGATSLDNPFFNLEHGPEFGLGGHLRVDLFTSIYAYSIPTKGDSVTRGVYFYGPTGASVLGVMMSGKGPPPPAAEIAKYDALLELMRSLPSACPTS